MTDDEIIAVVQAHKDGRKIQSRLRRRELCNDDWLTVFNPVWDFSACSYRVAPGPRKPREWIVGVTPDKHITSWRPDLMPHEVTETIRVREIID